MELDVRGTPGEQIREYLISMDGRKQPDGSLVGPGWRAMLAESSYEAFGVLVPRVVVTLTGDGAAVSTAAAALRLRVLRIGG